MEMALVPFQGNLADVFHKSADTGRGDCGWPTGSKRFTYRRHGFLTTIRTSSKSDSIDIDSTFPRSRFYQTRQSPSKSLSDYNLVERFFKTQSKIFPTTFFGYWGLGSTSLTVMLYQFGKTNVDHEESEPSSTTKEDMVSPFWFA